MSPKKRAVTFNLPPSPQCVIQRGKVIIRREDAEVLLKELSDQLYGEGSAAKELDSASTSRR